METVKTVIDWLLSIYHQLKLVVNESKLDFDCTQLVDSLTSRSNHCINHLL
ncbi:MAG: hypothetical protein ISS80_00935 [Candidatus Cloacimonetes bacterium]|nr:hypothetical protein [Candidatus Cloacimonadota bacterium]